MKAFRSSTYSVPSTLPGALARPHPPGHCAFLSWALHSVRPLMHLPQGHPSIVWGPIWSWAVKMRIFGLGPPLLLHLPS